MNGVTVYILGCVFGLYAYVCLWYVPRSGIMGPISFTFLV